jgi:hypothetical protein
MAGESKSENSIKESQKPEAPEWLLENIKKVLQSTSLA